jgi:hypothetical protein
MSDGVSVEGYPWICGSCRDGPGTLLIWRTTWELSGLLLLEAYTLATLFPERVRVIATLALAYQPRGEFHREARQQSLMPRSTLELSKMAACNG